MKRSLFLLAWIFAAFSLSMASAEQSKAEEYRQIFSSGSFYVEYEDNNVKRIIAEKDGKRMSRTALNGRYATIVSVLNPLGALFQSGNIKYPEFMHFNGKYYKFAEKDYATMLEDNRIDEENLNPKEGWSTIDKSLSLPDELAVFCWNDSYHKVSKAVSTPVFANSIKKTVDGKEYDCDRYEAIVKATSGRKGATIVYDLIYDNKGNLIMAQSAIFANGREYEINKVTVKKILRDIPENEFKVYEKAKVYAAGVGDMNDLLENPVLIGNFNDM